MQTIKKKNKKVNDPQQCKILFVLASCNSHIWPLEGSLEHKRATSACRTDLLVFSRHIPHVEFKSRPKPRLPYSQRTLPNYLPRCSLLEKTEARFIKTLFRLHISTAGRRDEAVWPVSLPLPQSPCCYFFLTIKEGFLLLFFFPN